MSTVVGIAVGVRVGVGVGVAVAVGVGVAVAVGVKPAATGARPGPDIKLKVVRNNRHIQHAMQTLTFITLSYTSVLYLLKKVGNASELAK